MSVKRIWLGLLESLAIGIVAVAPASAQQHKPTR
jgi:hypothetical protein